MEVKNSNLKIIEEVVPMYRDSAIFIFYFSHLIFFRQVTEGKKIN